MNYIELQNAFRTNIRIPDILFENNLSAHKDEKMLIQLIDLKQLARDVEPFLFQRGDRNKVLFFCDYIRDYEF